MNWPRASKEKLYTRCSSLYSMFWRYVWFRIVIKLFKTKINYWHCLFWQIYCVAQFKINFIKLTIFSFFVDSYNVDGCYNFQLIKTKYPLNWILIDNSTECIMSTMCKWSANITKSSGNINQIVKYLHNNFTQNVICKQIYY